MIVSVDAGNTRLKYRNDSNGRSGSAVAREDGWKAPFAEFVRQALVTKIRVSSVRGHEFNQSFIDFCISELGVRPDFARVEPAGHGVSPAYRDTSQLGVDRWLSMLAAYDRRPCSCVVISFGTAITFDYIRRDGRHVGGYILPGLDLLTQSLIQNVSAIQLNDLVLSRDPGPGSDTISCVANGLSLMLKSLLAQALSHCLDEAPVCIFLSGGDTENLSPLMPDLSGAELVYAPNLVLDGLKLAIPMDGVDG